MAILDILISNFIALPTGLTASGYPELLMVMVQIVSGLFLAIQLLAVAFISSVVAWHRIQLRNQSRTNASGHSRGTVISPVQSALSAALIRLSHVELKHSDSSA